LGERLKSQMETFAAAVSPTGLASAAALSEPGASAHFPVGSVIETHQALRGLLGFGSKAVVPVAWLKQPQPRRGINRDGTGLNECHLGQRA
jgi:hypothetical protein